AHLDETEALRPASIPVHDDLRRLDGAVSREHLFQITVADAVGQIAYVQLLAHEGLLKSNEQGMPYPRWAGIKSPNLHETVTRDRGKASEGWQHWHRGHDTVHWTQAP